MSDDTQRTEDRDLQDHIIGEARTLAREAVDKAFGHARKIIQAEETVPAPVVGALLATAVVAVGLCAILAAADEV